MDLPYVSDTTGRLSCEKILKNRLNKKTEKDKMKMRIFLLFRGLGPGPAGEVYKSNSSLDLDHEIDILQVNLLRH
jgi:hypothetical protein